MKIIPIKSELVLSKDHFYHGTTIDGLTKIVNSGVLGINYFDVNGFYLTNYSQYAFEHGNYVLQLSKNIDLSKLEECHDGYFHNGFLDLDSVIAVYFDCTSTVFFKDILNNLINKKLA